MILSEARQIIQQDLDLQDEKFITSGEVDRAINRAIREAGARILNIYEDYFLDFDYLPLDVDKKIYSLPTKIFANKIRRVLHELDKDYYVMKRLIDIDSTPIADDYNDYTYMLINNKDNGTEMYLYPAGKEKASFTYATELAKDIKSKFNKHIADTAAHTTAADTVDTITLADPTDKYSLFDLVNQLTTNYVEHQKDAAKTFGWSYHANTEATNSALSNTEKVYTLTEAITRLNDIYDAYTIHIADNVSHGLADDFPLVENKISNSDNNIKIWYIRKPREAVNDNDVLDIMEFEDYIIERAKYTLLKKDFGNPAIQSVAAETFNLQELMLHTLSYRQPDTQTDVRVKNDPYNGGIA